MACKIKKELTNSFYFDILVLQMFFEKCMNEPYERQQDNVVRVLSSIFLIASENS